MQPKTSGIYGRKMNEWNRLAKWVLGKHHTVRRAELIAQRKAEAEARGETGKNSNTGNASTGETEGDKKASKEKSDNPNNTSSGSGNSGNKSGSASASGGSNKKDLLTTPNKSNKSSNKSDTFHNDDDEGEDSHLLTEEDREELKTLEWKPLLSHTNMWMIQIPRLWEIYRKSKLMNNFGEMLANIFIPLFEVTVDPNKDPDLHEFLQYVGAVDTVDDESKSTGSMARSFSSRSKKPKDWDMVANPSYRYYSYFIQSNLRVLNKLRAARGMNQFKYRPHAGEAGEEDEKFTNRY
jgi:hypothetical protein